MKPETRKQIGDLVDELRSLDLDEVAKAAESQADGVLATGLPALGTLELLRELVGRLADALSDGRLDRVPASTVEKLPPALVTVRDAAKAAVAQQDQIPNVGAPVAKLHSLAWACNLLGVPEDQESLQVRLAHTERVARRMEEALAKAQSGLATLEKLEAGLQDLDTTKAAAKKSEDETTAARDAASEAAAKAEAALGESSTAKTEASAQRDAAKKSADETATFRTNVKAFVDEVDKLRARIVTAAENSETTVTKNDEETRKLHNRLEQLEERIKQQLQRATGAALFGSFSKRQSELGIAKIVWGALVLVSMVATGYGLYAVATSSSGGIGVAFIMKALATSVGGFAMWFTARQYARERALEEEYAFKASVSLALTPYQRLVAELASESPDEEHRKFVIETIRSIFETPRVMGGKSIESRLDGEDLSKVLGPLRKVAEALSPLVKGR